MAMPSRAGYEAFNRGSDARLRGEPLSANPYSKAASYGLWVRWNDGWRDVDRAWGRRAGATATPLPPVKG